MNVVYQQTCQRCHEDDGQRPGCHQQSDTHGVVFKRIDKHEGIPTMTSICAVNEIMLVATEVVNIGILSKSNN